MKPEEIIQLLGLEPHPKEGGYFREIYRSKGVIDNPAGGYKGSRVFSTAIYYMLTHGTFSTMHRLKSDEIFHLYMGGPVEMINLYPGGKGEIIHIGHRLTNGERPMVVVPKGVWQGARLAEGAEFALLGTTVAPGFEYKDYEDGIMEFLCSDYPDFSDKISELCQRSG
ncbi:MAG: cupin domain-containing protein [Brevinematales bacterium]|nr:cupin domain-containing protein [Brevinematales bacterium]